MENIALDASQSAHFYFFRITAKPIHTVPIHELYCAKFMKIKTGESDED